MVDFIRVKHTIFGTFYWDKDIEDMSSSRYSLGTLAKNQTSLVCRGKRLIFRHGRRQCLFVYNHKVSFGEYYKALNVIDVWRIICGMKIDSTRSVEVTELASKPKSYYSWHCELLDTHQFALQIAPKHIISIFRKTTSTINASLAASMIPLPLIIYFVKSTSLSSPLRSVVEN